MNTEHDHQKALFQWAATRKDLSLMFAIPNAAKRSMKLAAMMKSEGMKAGVPDICLPIARKGYHGMFIEMKRPKGKGIAAGKVSEAQQEWLTALAQEGYSVHVYYGWDAAREAIEEYMR